jgi:hypothetical protein
MRTAFATVLACLTIWTASGFKSGDGADHDCQELLSRSFKPEEDMTFNDVQCHQAHGTWRIDGDGIEFTFTDAERHVDDEGHLGRLARSVTHARLAPRDGRLAVVSGRLPAYGI